MFRIGMMSENSFKYFSLKESLKMMKDIGYECADISLMLYDNVRMINPEFAGDDYKEVAKELKKYADEIGMPLVQCHTPFPTYDKSDEEYSKNMFKTQIKCIEICSILGIKNVVIHPDNDSSDEWNRDFFNRLLPYAKENNVVICTENMWRWDEKIGRAKPCACSLPDSFTNTVNLVNDDNLKACVDIGHAEMFRHMGLSPRILLESLKKNVYCLHIHDNDGIHDYHLVPFDGIIDYSDVVKGLKNINYQGDLIVETGMPGEMTKDEAIEYFTKQYNAMKKFRTMLMEE